MTITLGRVGGPIRCVIRCAYSSHPVGASPALFFPRGICYNTREGEEDPAAAGRKEQDNEDH